MYTPKDMSRQKNRAHLKKKNIYLRFQISNSEKNRVGEGQI